MATVEFHKELLPEDPINRPCTIIGKTEYIKKLSYCTVSMFLEPRVNLQVIICCVSLNRFQYFFNLLHICA